MSPVEIAAKLDSISSVRDLAELRRLEAISQTLDAQEVSREVYCAILRLFERFPDGDAYEGFWSFLHLLEKHRHFEPLLVESVERTPALMTLLMVDRVLSSGDSRSASHNLRDVMTRAFDNPKISAENRAFVAQSIKRHVNSIDGA